MFARLYQRPKSSMQSGRARTGQWLLEFERREGQNHDPLTGWIGSGPMETQAQVQLHFPTREAALAYADANGLTVEVVPLGPRTLKLQAYADNFR